MDDLIINFLRMCCVQVKGERHGTGFFIAPNLLVTCAHVVGRERQQGEIIEVSQWQDGKINTLPPATIEANFPKDDIVFLRTTYQSPAFVPLGEESYVEDKVTAVGFPGKKGSPLFDQFTGVCEGPSESIDTDGHHHIEIKFKGGQTEKGYSGGPLLNRNNYRVIGVVDLSRDTMSDLGGWAIRAKVVKELLAKQGLALPDANPGWAKAEAEQRAATAGTASPTDKLLQLPPRHPKFINRKAEIDKLLAELQPGKVVTLWGPGGMGKTALVAEAVWSLTPNNTPPKAFPDGVIYHDFYTQPAAAVALENIALTYGVEPKPTPHEAAKRALSGRTALLLLDGTEKADDLRAVLGVTGNCGVIVTSRRQKDAYEDRQELKPLEPDHAIQLLRSWGGEQANDGAAAEEICTLVGRLPLAVTLAGRYMNNMKEPAVDYLTWLKQSPLEALDHGQRRNESVPVLLSRSMQQVSDLACELLRVAGLLSFTPFGRDVLSAALNRPENELRPPLEELVDYGLLISQGGRYVVSHALIHTYAREKVPPALETIQRLAAYYDDFARKRVKEGLEGYKRLDTEREHIIRVMHRCVELEENKAALSLAWVIINYLDIQGYYSELITISQTGLKIARQIKDKREESVWLTNLGLAYRSLGQVEQAIDYHQQASVIHLEIGDRQGEAADLGNLGIAYRDLGQVEQAIEYYEQALVIDREIGYRQGEANALANLGLAYRDLGQLKQAIDYHQQALVIHREIGYRQGEAVDLGNLGVTYRDLGQLEQAIEYLKQALDIFVEIKSPYANQAREQLAEWENTKR